MLRLTWSQVAAWRVRRHHLDQRAPAGSMLEVASRLCGLHAQVLSSAVLTVWARVEEVDRRAVHRALWEDRTLVKTWAMRGTLHLLPTGDLPLWQAALRTSRRYRKPALWRRFGLTLVELDRLTEAIGTALDGCVMTREELAHEVRHLTGSAKFAAKLAYGGWSTILKPAAMSGRLCFGPSIGQRVRFTHPGTWVTMSAPQMDSQTATATVTRRFFRHMVRPHITIWRGVVAAPSHPANGSLLSVRKCVRLSWAAVCRAGCSPPTLTRRVSSGHKGRFA